MNKEFLILGVGRSGTGYISELFSNLGYPIGHEKMGEYGIASWLFAVNSEPKNLPNNWGSFTPKLRRKEDTFNHVINVIRNPVHVIRSFANFPPPDNNEWRKEFISIDKNLNPMEQLIKIYIEWNKLILNQNPNLTVKLESASSTIPKYLIENNFPLPEQITLPSSNTNSKGKNKELTIEHIKYWTNPELLDEFNKEIQLYEKLD
tara:strand:+ start:2217 stop:2831 length:615 start_codon:yes stop_codon:yes gene_type:complete